MSRYTMVNILVSLLRIELSLPVPKTGVLPLYDRLMAQLLGIEPSVSGATEPFSLHVCIEFSIGMVAQTGLAPAISAL